MGAESSAQRDGKSQEDASVSASAGELSAEVNVLQEGGDKVKRLFSSVPVHTSVRSGHGDRPRRVMLTFSGPSTVHLCVCRRASVSSCASVKCCIMCAYCCFSFRFCWVMGPSCLQSRNNKKTAAQLDNLHADTEPGRPSLWQVLGVAHEQWRTDPFDDILMTLEHAPCFCIRRRKSFILSLLETKLGTWCVFETKVCKSKWDIGPISVVCV